jgi:pyruvate dehydrogenase E2 component (dihydrolipoamide acetyltransferase)
MQMTIARRMGHSKATIPHFYVTVEVRMDDALNLQDHLRATVRGAEGVNVTDMVVRASAMALRSFPRMNSSWAGGHAEVNQAINIGLAVDIANGLLVPVIQDAGNKRLLEIANERHHLVARAKEGIMSESAASGGTFTVSNLGMFGVDEFAAIINPPEAAILAVGMLKDAAVVDRGELAVGRVMRMTLSVDHRVCNGTDAALFLGRVRTLLERPTSMVELDGLPSIDREERGGVS